MHEVIVYRGDRQEQAGRACIRAEMVHDHLTSWTRLHAATRSTTFHCTLRTSSCMAIGLIGCWVRGADESSGLILAAQFLQGQKMVDLQERG